MSDLTTTQPVTAQTLEHVLATGDLSKLTSQERLAYYVRTCQSLGLNPLTRPFRFLSLNGQIQLYATKDCTDQLRAIHGIALHLVDKQIESDLYVVTARARSKDGREDEDIGAVMLPRAGESRANALMKGTTKAKRRVTLSICGLGGMPDESELDGMPGAMTFDAEDETPISRITEKKPRTIGQWLDGIEIALRDAADRVEVDRILDNEEVLEIAGKLPPGTAGAERFRSIKAAALARHPPTTDGDRELPPIKGEENVMAG